jgi:hypothetical protein
MKRTALLVSASLLLNACGSIMHGGTQDVGISSSPTGATVKLNSGMTGQTPFVAKLSRKENHVVNVTAPGYAPADLTLTRGVSGWVWGNLVFGGLIGLGVDAMTGGLYKLTPEQLSTTLAKQTGATVAPTKDGIYVVLVPVADPAWTKVGQLTRLDAATAVGE